jgi:hypothetical protein
VLPTADKGFLSLDLTPHQGQNQVVLLVPASAIVHHFLQLLQRKWSKTSLETEWHIGLLPEVIDKL